MTADSVEESLTIQQLNQQTSFFEETMNQWAGFEEPCGLALYFDVNLYKYLYLKHLKPRGSDSANVGQNLSRSNLPGIRVDT